jgi:formylglycine-generating enzyme
MRRVSLLVALPLLGCQTLAGFEDFQGGSAAATGGTGGTGGSGGSGGSGNAPAAGAAGQAAPCTGGTWLGNQTVPMVELEGADGACFFIGQTEVTRAQYQAFLTAQGTTPAQAPPCDANDSLVPTCEWAGPGGGDGDLPVVCVDWCDAQAYCTWAQMRLCSGSYVNFADARQSEWFSACSNRDTTTFPYGSNYDRTVCNGADGLLGAGHGLTTAASNTACATPEGVLNLSGNAAEWVNECNNSTSGSDNCNVRGGSFLDTNQDLQCGTKTAPARNASFRHIGFRCCADPA